MNPIIEEEETRHVCVRCEDSFLESEGYDEDYCSSYCYDRDRDDDYEDSDGEIPERKWQKGDFVQFQSKERGQIVKSQRAFSVEIEAYYEDSYDVHRVYDKMPVQLGISKDGSLNSNGVEFQTPKLRGLAGEKLVTDLTDILNERNFRVDRSTGLHIHIDGEGLLPRTRTKHNPGTVKNLLLLYITFEDVIQSILPRSRRNNNYARHVRHNFHRTEIEKCETLEDIEKLWYRVAKRKELKNQKEHHYNTTRYNGLNLHSLFSSGHLEIRYHSGTINGEKILRWVDLHTAMVDYAHSVYGIQPQNELTNLREKTERLFQLIGLSEETAAYYYNRQNLFAGINREEDTENRDSNY